MKALLIGNPNVGKSALFNQMTGVTVKTSNYAGTTVTLTEGKWRIPVVCDSDCSHCKGCFRAGREIPWLDEKTQNATLIDVPGTYSLDPDIAAEQVASSAVSDCDVILNVMDATNLERNLLLTMDLIRLNKPMMLVLNMWDETAHKGIQIDIEVLSDLLGLPVITTNGRTGEGVSMIGAKLNEACVSKINAAEPKDKWTFIGEIINKVQSMHHHHHTFIERLQEISMHPVFGLVIVLLVLTGVFKLVTFIGEGLISLTSALFNTAWIPLMTKLYHALSQIPWLRELLVGTMYEGSIDLEASMGMLTTGLFIPLGLVFPYLLVFYTLMGFLEDFGYLPRLSVLLDRFFHRVGLHGYSVIPMMLATGCTIPGALALRNLETRREKFITAAIMCTTIPCMAQTAVVISIIGRLGPSFIWLLFGSLVFTGISLGLFLNVIIKGDEQPLVVDIPPYRLPSFKLQIKKLMMRLGGFFREAVPLMMAGILLVQTLQITGILKGLFRLMEPVVSGLWGLPKETASAMLVGLIRKDAGVALLEPLSLDPGQLLTAVLVLILYFPCIATYTVLVRELHGKDLAKITMLMLVTTIIIGSLMRLAISIFSPLFILLIEGILLCIFLLTNYFLKIYLGNIQPNKQQNNKRA